MFEKTGTIVYPYNGGVELAAIVLANLPNRLNIDQSYVVETKIIGDGETPEALAHRYYKRADFHWVLMYINGIRDPYTEWPIREGFLREFADLKYGVDSLSTIRHLVDIESGEEIHDNAMLEIMAVSPPYPANIHPVSYFEYEQTLNNARREIIAIAPRYIHEFVSLYEDLIKGTS